MLNGCSEAVEEQKILIVLYFLVIVVKIVERIALSINSQVAFSVVSQS